MKHSAVIFLCLALLAGCQASGIRGYWNSVPLLEEDLSVSEDRFAQFAELTASAPEKEALEAIDILFDKLCKDTLAYYIYAEWAESAYYNLLSPCRNAALYSKAVDRMVADRVLTESEILPSLQKREWIQYNLKGARATVPGVIIKERTLVLVLDKGCPSCKEALSGLAEKLADTRRIAVCCGYGAVPAVPGWEYVTEKESEAVFDPRMTPIYFVVSPDGTVETPYTLVF